MLTLLRARRVTRLRRQPEFQGASRPLRRAGSWQPSFFWRGYRCDCVRLPEYRCDQIRLPHARQAAAMRAASPSAVSLPAMALEMSASIFVLAGRPGLLIKRVNNFSGNFAIHL